MTTSTDGAAAAAFLEGAPVPVLATEFDRASSDFATNRDSMRALVEGVQAALATVQAGGGKAQVERHRSRGKLTARERIDRLTDTGSAFLELCPLAAWEMYENDAPAAGIITGIGRVCGREAVIIANDATVKGGTYYPITVKKHLRAQESSSRAPAPSSSAARPS